MYNLYKNFMDTYEDVAEQLTLLVITYNNN